MIMWFSSCLLSRAKAYSRRQNTRFGLTGLITPEGGKQKESHADKELPLPTANREADTISCVIDFPIDNLLQPPSAFIPQGLDYKA